ncbi:hypothetical protein ES703_09170 [subsurface metagenome]
MPYPKEYSCRLEDPKKFDKFRRKNGGTGEGEEPKQKHDGKYYDIINAHLKGKPPKEGWKRQAIRYPLANKWKEAGARSHCKEHDGTFEPAKKETKATKEAKVVDVKFSKDSKTVFVRLEAPVHVLREGITQEELNKMLAEEEPEEGFVPPKDSEFILAEFRLISKTLIRDYWVDFSEDDVLKNAVGLAVGKPVLRDHHRTVENYAGVVESTSWDESSDPQGINGVLKVDTKQAPVIARGLLVEPPTVNCVSVTLSMEIKQSHDRGDFRQLLGTEVDGELVRWIVTEIREIPEVSFVWAGADPGATRRHEEESEDKDGADDDTPADVKEEAESLIKAGAQLNKLQRELEEVSKVKDELTPLAELGKDYLGYLRAEVLRLAKLTERDTAPIAALVNGTEDVKVLKELAASYRTKAEDNFPATCPKCGAKIVLRRSSVDFSLEPTRKTKDVDESAYQDRQPRNLRT